MKCLQNLKMINSRKVRKKMHEISCSESREGSDLAATFAYRAASSNATSTPAHKSERFRMTACSASRFDFREAEEVWLMPGNCYECKTVTRCRCKNMRHSIAFAIYLRGSWLISTLWHTSSRCTYYRDKLSYVWLISTVNASWTNKGVYKQVAKGKQPNACQGCLLKQVGRHSTESIARPLHGVRPPWRKDVVQSHTREQMMALMYTYTYIMFWHKAGRSRQHGRFVGIDKQKSRSQIAY